MYDRWQTSLGVVVVVVVVVDMVIIDIFLVPLLNNLRPLELKFLARAPKRFEFAATTTRTARPEVNEVDMAL